MSKQVGWFQTHQEHLPQGELVSMREGLSAGDIRNGWKQEPVFIVEQETGVQTRKDVRLDVALAWTVLNGSGVVVAEVKSLSEAIEYLTPQRLSRGWCAVCVVDLSNLPAACSD